jgi:hypothetical protein
MCGAHSDAMRPCNIQRQSIAYMKRFMRLNAKFRQSSLKDYRGQSPSYYQIFTILTPIEYTGRQMSRWTQRRPRSSGLQTREADLNIEKLAPNLSGAGRRMGRPLQQMKIME